MARRPGAADGRPVTPRAVVVLGLPRSGTTWTAKLLGCAPGTVTVMEPDNEKTSVAAMGAKRAVGRFPVLGAGDEPRPFRDLWAWALGGAGIGPGQRLGRRLAAPATAADREALVSGRPPARLRLAGLLSRPPRRPPPGAGGAARVVAKSVHVPLAAEWLADAFDVDVVVVLRHPANVLASWLELDLPDRDRRLDALAAVKERYVDRWHLPPPGPTPLDRAVWQLGLMTAALEEASSRHPQWHVRLHEELCAAPEEAFRRLYEDLGLRWSSRTLDELERGNRPGEGFSLERRLSEVADGWHTRLGAPEQAALRRGLAPFPLRHWSQDDIAGDVCAG